MQRYSTTDLVLRGAAILSAVLVLAYGYFLPRAVGSGEPRPTSPPRPTATPRPPTPVPPTPTPTGAVTITFSVPSEKCLLGDSCITPVTAKLKSNDTTLATGGSFTVSYAAGTATNQVAATENPGSVKVTADTATKVGATSLLEAWYHKDGQQKGYGCKTINVAIPNIWKVNSTNAASNTANLQTVFAKDSRPINIDDVKGKVRCPLVELIPNLAVDYLIHDQWDNDVGGGWNVANAPRTFTASREDVSLQSAFPEMQKWLTDETQKQAEWKTLSSSTINDKAWLVFPSYNLVTVGPNGFQWAGGVGAVVVQTADKHSWYVGILRVGDGVVSEWLVAKNNLIATVKQLQGGTQMTIQTTYTVNLQKTTPP